MNENELTLKERLTAVIPAAVIGVGAVAVFAVIALKHDAAVQETYANSMKQLLELNEKHLDAQLVAVVEALNKK